MKRCISVEYDDIGRIYVFDDGTRYYSATTMLGATGNKDALHVWQKRVGTEEATRISNEAANLGEQYHQLGEDWLNGVPLSKVDPFIERIFKGTYRVLRANVTKIHAVEETLHTDTYGLAGRADAIVDWNNELMVLDFKLLKHHNKEWLKDYWLQIAIYAQCWYEMYGVKPKKGVLVVGNKENKRTRFFVSNVQPWVKKLNYRMYAFKSMINNQ